MSDILVRLDDVTRHHAVGSETVFALQSVSCSVRTCEHVVVIGASGSGKSTLLAHMASLDRPNFGFVTWPSLPAETLLRPQYVSVSFQSPSLLPSLTVQQNVEVPLLVLGQQDTEQKSIRMLERLGIAHLRERLPDEISGGQAQRVALARAMATEPALLLADEPTGQLDQETGQSTIGTLIAWADQIKTTLVVATHDSQVARKFKTQWSMSFGVLKGGDAS